MGGPGSGRQPGDTSYGSKRTTEGSLPLDIRELARSTRGFRHNARRVCTWNNNSSILMVVRWQRDESLRVELHYSHHGEPVTCSIPVTWTKCNYGGQRAWWECSICGRRCAVVYGRGKGFACRQCLNLCYGSQKEIPRDRLIRRARKIRQRLGQEWGAIDGPDPTKPVGMHWDTYERLVGELIAAQMTYLGKPCKWLDDIISKYDQST